jgi:predicted  nucleic acid-binding Zn ribbon protein
MIQDYKILFVKQEYRPYAEEGDCPELSVQEMSVEKLLEIKEVQDELKRLGWKDVKKIEERELKLALDKKFFILSRMGGGAYAQSYQIDIDNLQAWEVNNLSRDAIIAQQVDLKTILSEDQYKENPEGAQGAGEPASAGSSRR